MQHRIILPGATTLTRLISEVREKATLRLWNKLALIPSAEQRSQLEMLLGPTDCSRLSLLESLKKGPVTISGPAFNEAIERWKTLNDFGLHAENLSTLRGLGSNGTKNQRKSLPSPFSPFFPCICINIAIT